MDNQTTGQKSGWGLVVATILVLAIIIIGALYFWQNRTPATTSGEAAVSGQPSESAASIETDINSVNVDGADQDLNSSVNAS